MKGLNFLLTALIYLVLRPKCFSTVERTAEMYFGEQWLIMLVNQSATKASQPERCQCLKIILVNHLNATKACQPTKYVLQVIMKICSTLPSKLSFLGNIKKLNITFPAPSLLGFLTWHHNSLLFQLNHSSSLLCDTAGFLHSVCMHGNRVI